MNGAFAEYTWVPVVLLNKNVIKLADTMSYHEGTLVEPMGLGVYVAKRAEPKPGDLVVILGAGMVGLAVLVNFRHLGISKIVVSDISEKRLKVAKELGASRVVNPSAEDLMKLVMEETAGVGANIVVEAAGKPATFLQSIDMVRADGKVMVVAVYEEPIMFDPSLARPGMISNSLVRKNVRILGCQGADFLASFELMKAGKLKGKQVVTHVFPLDRIVQAMETQMNARESIKVIIEP